MKRTIDIDAILAPIAGENPAGEDLRYTLHDEIKEARREDDPFERGAWERDLKRADWEKVVSLCTYALIEKTKDLQIAAWLTEALTVTEGFDGLYTGLKTINSFLENLWEHVYPEIEDDDLDFRLGRLEYLNTSLWSRIKEVPLTDKSAKAGYSWLQWDESRQVGYETDTSKAKQRDELVAEGKLTAEEFDAAVAQSSRSFYELLAEQIDACHQEFERFETIVDERFGDDAPRLAEMRTAIEDCAQLVKKILKDKRDREPDREEPEPAAVQQEPAQTSSAVADEVTSQNEVVFGHTESEPKMETGLIHLAPIADTGARETALWEKSLGLLNSAGIRPALNQLLVASSTATSVRERHRYRLLVAKLCLKANRPDLARPIVEELHALIEELNLERWESPQWIAEVLDALYKCLTAGEPTSDDLGKAQDLFRRLCTLDVTKAMLYNQ